MAHPPSRYTERAVPDPELRGAQTAAQNGSQRPLKQVGGRGSMRCMRQRSVIGTVKGCQPLTPLDQHLIAHVLSFLLFLDPINRPPSRCCMHPVPERHVQVLCAQASAAGAAEAQGWRQGENAARGYAQMLAPQGDRDQGAVALTRAGGRVSGSWRGGGGGALGEPLDRLQRSGDVEIVRVEFTNSCWLT